MKLEELEIAWQRHSAGTATAADADQLTRRLTRQLDRRSLYLKLLLGCTAVGLLLELEPLFRLGQNYPPADGLRFAAELAKFAAHQALYAALFAFLLRRLRARAQQARASGESIRAGVTMSLAAVEAEMTDYRRAAWFAVPASALMLWSAYLNQAVARHGLEAFWPRAGVVLGLVGVITAIAMYYYHRRLVPEHARLQSAARDWRA